MKKKILGVILAMVMLMGMTINVNAAFGRSYTAPKGTPTIDGEIDELWKTAEWTAVDKVHDATRETDSVMYIKLLWDDAHLYFLANVYDSTENARNDLVEVYIDQNDANTRFYEADDFHTRFYVRKNGAVNTGTANDGANGQVNAPSFSKSLGDNKFIVEGQLDWKGGTPSVGDKMGLEFMYNDGNMFQAFTEAYRWNADTRNGDEPPFASTEFFGELVLAAEGTPDEKNNTLPAEAGEQEDNQVVVNKKDDAAKDETEDNKSNANNDKKAEGNNALWIAIAAAAVIIVVVIIVIIVASKKKQTKSESKQ